MTFDPSDALFSSQGFSSQICPQYAISEQIALWLTPADPFWPQQCITLWSGIILTKFGGHMTFPSIEIKLWLTPVDPYMTFDHHNALHTGQIFLWPNLVATAGHF